MAKPKRATVGTASPALDAAVSFKEGNSGSTERPVTTGISLPAKTWSLLLDVANVRKKRRGGRASVSALIVDVIEQHRAELEAELR